MMKLTSVFVILGLVHDEASASSSIATIPVGGGNVVNMIDTGVTFSLKLHGSATAMNNTTSDSASQEAPTSPPHWVDNEPKNNATFCFDIHQVQQDNDDIPLPSPTLAPREEDEVADVVEQQQVETVIAVQVQVEEEPQEQCNIDSIKFIEDVVHPARRSLKKKRKTLTKKKRSVVDALSNMQQQAPKKKPSFPPQPVHVQEAPIVHPEEPSCDGDNIKFIVDVVHTARRTHKKMKQQQQETVKQVIKEEEEVQQEQEEATVQEEEPSVCDVTNILYITDVVHPARRAHKKMKSSSMKVQQQQVVLPPPQQQHESCDGTNIRFISEVVHPARRTYNKKNKSMVEVLLQVPESSSSCDVTNILFISDVVHPARRTFNRTADVPQQVTSQPQQEESCDATNIKFITDVVHPARRQHQQRR